MEKFVAIFILFFSFPALAQDSCYSLGKCTLNGAEMRSEVVPQAQLAKCEDYKTKSLAVPGLILAERKALVASSKCAASKDIFAAQLTVANIELGKEREGRQSAENRVVWVGAIAFVAGVIVTVSAAFLVVSVSK